jgi:cell division protease FtsH
MEDMHTLSGILIERETIDKDQFERLLAGESEADVFPEEPAPVVEPEPTPREKRPQPKPKPFPLPGALSQPPPPEGAKP